MAETNCVFCDLDNLRGAEVYFENTFCVYASTRDPRDPPDVLPGCGVIIPLAHRLSPFDFTPEEWGATHDLLLKAKAAQDERLAPDGYALIWNCFSEVGQPPHHAHLHVIPRFDDEPLADRGGRSAIKVPQNFSLPQEVLPQRGHGLRPPSDYLGLHSRLAPCASTSKALEIGSRFQLARSL